jgi:hypothetical protein
MPVGNKDWSVKREFMKANLVATGQRSPHLRVVGANKQEIEMLTKTKAVLAAVLIFGTAPAALASASGEDYGFVMPGNGGANPAYHPKWFPNYHSGATAYGLAKHTHRAAHHPER